MPSVEGNRYPNAFQNGGMEYIGHDTPDMNTNMTEVKTKSIMTSSLLFTNPESVMEKNIQANKWGNRNKKMSNGCPTCGNEKICGTITKTHKQMTV